MFPSLILIQIFCHFITPHFILTHCSEVTSNDGTQLECNTGIKRDLKIRVSLVEKSRYAKCSMSWWLTVLVIIPQDTENVDTVAIIHIHMHSTRQIFLNFEIESSICLWRCCRCRKLHLKENQTEICSHFFNKNFSFEFYVKYYNEST